MVLQLKPYMATPHSIEHAMLSHLSPSLILSQPLHPIIVNRQTAIMAPFFPESWETHNYGRPSHAFQRPLWEPPVLDYRKYEEDGDMYDSLHRHPRSALGPKRWYEHTDLHIEQEILHDYLAWVNDRWNEAWENKNANEGEFYGGMFEDVLHEHGFTNTALPHELMTRIFSV